MKKNIPVNAIKNTKKNRAEFMQSLLDSVNKKNIPADLKKEITTLTLKFKKDEKSITVTDIVELMSKVEIFFNAESEKNSKSAKEKTSKSESKKTLKAKKEKAKEVKEEISEEVFNPEYDFKNIFKKKITFKDLELNLERADDIKSLDDLRSSLEDEDNQIIMLAYWSEEDLKEFDYASNRNISKSLVPDKFEKNFDICELTICKTSCDETFFTSIITEASYRIIEEDFTIIDNCYRDSNNQPFNLYYVK